jgi:hypothetical protein
MERVMNNTVLGAKPLRPDGTFYYRDDNFKGHKVHQNRRWRCYSGTLPQSAAGRRGPAEVAGEFQHRHDRRLALTAIRDKVYSTF